VDCREAQPLIAGFVDRELDPKTEGDIDRHLRECPRCAGERDRQTQVKQAVRTAAPYHMPSESLMDRIRASVEASGGPGIPESAADSARPVRFRVSPAVRAWALAAAFVIVFVTAFGIGRYTGGRIRPAVPAQAILAQEVVACHIRSLMAAHLTDVISTDKHTVKPWYAGRLSFSPPVEDFAARGYPLIGGRLDYVDGHQAAALVYRFRKHTINAFVWPASGAPPSAETVTRLQGYNIVQWSDSEMAWAVVSDLNGEDLERFAGLLQTSEKSQAPEKR
jgi:anti-sigma factor RsiW